MILEVILSIVFNVLEGLLALLPDISWNVDNNALSGIFDLIDVILYIFPINTVLTIFALVIIINNFKIVISIIKTIWDLLPFA